jgi:hypothetical protein
MNIGSIGKTAEPVPMQPVNAPSVAGANRTHAAHGHAHAHGHRATALEEMLTPEELEFFQQMESLGPLTYARGASPGVTAAAPLGQRIDTRG